MGTWQLAARNLTRSHVRTALALITVAVGVLTVLSVRGFITGMQQAFLENLVLGGSGAVQVHRAGFARAVLAAPLTLDFGDDPATRRTLGALDGVGGVSGRLEFGALVSTADQGDAPGRSTPVLVTAFDPAQERRVTPLRFERSGLGATWPDDALWLGERLAAGLALDLERAGAPAADDRLALLASDRDGALNGVDVSLRGRIPAAVPGERRVAWVPLALAQRLLRMEGRLTSLALAVPDLGRADQVAQAAQAALGPDFEVTTWEASYPFLRQQMALVDLVSAVVMLVFLAVGLLGVVNVMLMSVLERTREVGSWLAMGMRRREVVRTFVAEGLLVGGAGAVLGAALALALVAWAGSAGLEIPAAGTSVPMVVRPRLEPWVVALVLLGTPLGAALASLWPARRAGRLSPAAALADR
ncbi:MAG: FtsX-like permease family protein [Myxococcaceae bacterium]|nr:FtsX-like permease family protein [Myxococcaceae bacterium]